MLDLRSEQIAGWSFSGPVPVQEREPHLPSGSVLGAWRGVQQVEARLRYPSHQLTASAHLVTSQDRDGARGESTGYSFEHRASAGVRSSPQSGGPIQNPPIFGLSKIAQTLCPDLLDRIDQASTNEQLTRIYDCANPMNSHICDLALDNCFELGV
jgi:hypothetical protein